MHTFLDRIFVDRNSRSEKSESFELRLVFIVLIFCPLLLFPVFKEPVLYATDVTSGMHVFTKIWLFVCGSGFVDPIMF